MKKSLILCTMLFSMVLCFGQTRKTTTDMKVIGISETWLTKPDMFSASYYEDEMGNITVDGPLKMNFSFSVENSNQKGTVSHSYNFKDGKVHGNFSETVKADVKYKAPTYGYLKSEYLTLKDGWTRAEYKYYGFHKDHINGYYINYQASGSYDNGNLNGLKIVYEEKTIDPHYKVNCDMLVDDAKREIRWSKNCLKTEKRSIKWNFSAIFKENKSVAIDYSYNKNYNGESNNYTDEEIEKNKVAGVIDSNYLFTGKIDSLYFINSIACMPQDTVILRQYVEGKTDIKELGKLGYSIGLINKHNTNYAPLSVVKTYCDDFESDYAEAQVGCIRNWFRSYWHHPAAYNKGMLIHHKVDFMSESLYNTTTSNGADFSKVILDEELGMYYIKKVDGSPLYAPADKQDIIAEGQRAEKVQLLIKEGLFNYVTEDNIDYLCYTTQNKNVDKITINKEEKAQCDVLIEKKRAESVQKCIAEGNVQYKQESDGKYYLYMIIVDKEQQRMGRSYNNDKQMEQKVEKLSITPAEKTQCDKILKVKNTENAKETVYEFLLQLKELSLGGTSSHYYYQDLDKKYSSYCPMKSFVVKETIPIDETNTKFIVSYTAVIQRGSSEELLYDRVFVDLTKSQTVTFKIKKRYDMQPEVKAITTNIDLSKSFIIENTYTDNEARQLVASYIKQNNYKYELDYGKYVAVINKKRIALLS